MKKILLLLVMTLLPMVASAYSVYIDGINYRLSNKTAEVIPNSAHFYSGDIVIPSEITYNANNKYGGTYSVTSIANNAFEYCTNLTSVVLPNSITSIGYSAFRNCSNLTSITIPDSVTAIKHSTFEGCSSLISITIPNSVTSIAAETFKNCSGLTSITIGNSVTFIGKEAFYGCSGLTSLTIPNDVASIGSSAFQNCTSLTSLTIPNGVTSIEDGTFNGCTDLAFITLGSDVTSIGNNAFAHCSSLISLTISNSVTSIGNAAFFDCIGLTSLTIPNDVRTIGSSAFDGCCSLTSINIPNGVTSIEDRTFNGCTGLASVTFGSGLTSIGYNAFNGCSSLISLTIPDSVASIENGAFNGCTGLTSVTFHCQQIKSWFRDFSSIKEVTIGDEVTSIGEYAFYKCSGLTSLIIPNSVTTIGNYAFGGCTGLTSVTIGSGVTTIGSNAFQYCFSLKKVVVPDIASWCGITFGSKQANPLYYAHHIYSDDNTEITNLVIPESVTNVGEYVFSGCTEFKTIEAFCKKISLDDFSGCQLLESITVKNSTVTVGNEIFKGKKALKSVSFTDCDIFIRESAFYGCGNLKIAELRGGNIEIGESVFGSCQALKDLIVEGNIKTIERGTFSGCISLTTITIPDSVTSIGESAFSGCSSLSSITIPESVTCIGSSAFSGCNSLSSITIPDGIVTIESGTFYGCCSLNSFTISESVTTIGSSAFKNSGITSIHLPSTTTSIGENAFNCEKLVRVESDIAIPPASERFFSDFTYNEGYLVVPQDAKFEYETTNGWKQFASMYELDSVKNTDFTVTVEQEGTLNDIVEALETSVVESLTIKGRLNGKDIAFLVSKKGKVAHLNSLDLKDVTLVSDNTMYNSIFYGVNSDGASTETTCYYLSDGNYKREEWVSNGLGGYKTTIHYYNNHLAGAFHDMNLRKIVMPASITQIGERTFQDNKLLEEVWFPESVTSIGGGHPGRNTYAGAFYNCSSLTTIPSLAHVENIEEAAFAYCANITGEIDLSSAKTVKENAFYCCSGISSVKFSSKLESVDAGAFAGCSALSDVNYDENADVIYSRLSFSSTPWNEKLPTENGIVYMGKVAMAVEKGTEPRELTFREGTVSIAHDFFDMNTYEKIRTVNLPNSVKRIGNSAFSPYEVYSSDDGSNIEYINFPEGLIEIGSYAFAFNKRIQKLALPNSVKHVGYYTFARMEKLQSVENYNVSYSEPYTFYDCDMLESVKFGSNVENISEKMFSYCKKLTKVEFDERNNSLPLTIEEGAFSSCENLAEILLPEGVDSIGKEAFRDCYSLTSIKIPSTLKSIERSTFYNCEKLQKVIIEDIAAWCNNTINENLRFEKHLYMNDEEIKDLVIPNTATSIADYAFWNCIGLTSVATGDGITSIGESAFADCTSLTSATIGSGVTSIGDGAFYSCSSLTSIDIPNNVTSLGSSAFSRCSSLDSITIGNGVTSIGDEAFYRCTALSSVIIGNGIISIGDEAFNYCTALTSVTIGSGVTSIGERAFYYCGELTDVYCYAENVPSTYSDTFISGYLKNATLHVPSGSIDAYKSSYPWSSFGSIVKIAKPEHTLTYMVDGEVYKSYSIEEGETITPEPSPTKEGYSFSGWSDIPETMPDHDVTVTGTFSINSYMLTYMIDDKVYKETVYEYGAAITPEPKPEGDYATFEWKDLPQTMPAHDVVVYASYTSGIAEILMNTQRSIRIYSTDGKKLDKPQKGLNIVIFDDGTIKKIVVK